MKKVRKYRKAVVWLLCLAMLFSLAACGKDSEKDTRKQLKSIFDFFNDPVEPATQQPSTEGSTEAHTGDVIVDPPTPDTTKYADKENEELNKLFDEMFKESVTASTVSYRSYIKDGANFGVEPPKEASWGTESLRESFSGNGQQEVQKWIDKLKAIDVNTLTEQQRFDYDLVLEDLERSLVVYDNVYIDSQFAPMRGLQSELPSVFTDFIFREKADFQLYIDLMNKVPELVDVAMINEQDRVDNGYCYEDCVIDKIIKQCDEFLETHGGEHFLITTFNKSVDAFDGLTDAEKAELKKKNEEAVNNAMIPAYNKIKEKFSGWKGKNKIKGGLCNYKDHGSEIYEYMLWEATGSSKTPEELIRYLEQKEGALRAELNSLYMTNMAAVNAFSQQEDTKFDYLSGKSVEEVVKLIMDSSMEEFPEIGDLKFKATYFDESMEEVKKDVAAYYMLPAIDDPEGNLIRMNGKDTSRPWVTLAHEGCPGHMYQTNYYRKTNPNNIRLIAIELGYMEGWAVYASYESLKHCDFGGSEYADVFAELSRIEESISYLYYGRIDLGVNYEGWTETEVKKYMEDKGLKSDKAGEMYTLFLGDPAVYLSYSVGYFEMQDLRDYAEQSLGSKFNLVEYHKAILDAGPCKYAQLKKKVDKYILEHK